MTIKIAVTGAHGVGKTTLVSAVVSQMKLRFSIEEMPEIPRIVCGLANDPEFLRRSRNTVLKQLLLVYAQVQFEAIPLLRKKLDVLISDRALLDHWAYTKYFFTQELQKDGMLDIYEHFISEYCQTYDRLFYVPIEFAPIDDGIREDDVDFQKSIDDIILHFLSDHKLAYIVASGSIETRTDQVISELHSLVGGN